MAFSSSFGPPFSLLRVRLRLPFHHLCLASLTSSSVTVIARRISDPSPRSPPSQVPIPFRLSLASERKIEWKFKLFGEQATAFVSFCYALCLVCKS
uniref:Uncharacterized protein n=1 Tax=Rhizophora mucronata TaxID=61149 RepID=A0A2P2QV21_RHIMU